MEQYHFQKAVPIWHRKPLWKYNQFMGFHAKIVVENRQEIVVSIGARTCYRLYINGEFVANGPARAAEGYCRIDQIHLTLDGDADIAVEISAYDKPDQYCNDCTMEPGLFIAEVADMRGNVLAASGADFRITELLCRKSEVETMSHSRSIIEWQELDEESFAWRKGIGDFQEPIEVATSVTFLRRRAPYPDYHRIPLEHFSGICSLEQKGNSQPGFVLSLAREMNPQWYGRLPQENLFLESLRNLSEECFQGKYAFLDNGNLRIEPRKRNFAVTFENRESDLGFIEFTITAEKTCTVCVLNSDHLDTGGKLRANTYVTRYDLTAGQYHLITMDAKLCRYVRLIVSTEGGVEISFPSLIDYSCPDRSRTFFSCSDGDLNRIYEGAKKTLRLSTLDIFMDCPQRERGGWLCDSLFSSRAFWRMFGDLSVEKDFLENFMLTDGKKLWKGFFPEVYPSKKKDASEPGFINWSFWLLLELAEYYGRSGDEAFVDSVKGRVEIFVDGLISLRGESGLLETERSMFVDWSMANRNLCMGPINIPNNCLAVFTLERMAELYVRDDWKKTAEEMRAIIENIEHELTIFGGSGDGASWTKEGLKRGEVPTEGGIALELWSGFHQKDTAYVRSFVQMMGPKSEYRANPNIGKANLFIGLMLRFDVLARLGKVDTLVYELKDIYLEELRVGSGTFFENVNALSGCHGFNGMAGALLISHVLGLKHVSGKTKTVVISPNPCSLRWARGSAWTKDGLVLVEWNCDSYEHTLGMMLQKPDGWNVRFERPFALSGWNITINGESV